MGGDVSKAKAEGAESRRKRLRQIVHQGTVLLVPFFYRRHTNILNKRVYIQDS